MEISVTLLALKLMVSSLVIKVVSALVADKLPHGQPRQWALATCALANLGTFIFGLAWIFLVIWA